MGNTYPITPEQKAILGKFTCERLTASMENLFKSQFFESERGEGLVENMKKNGCAYDTKGKTAYYVVKNPDDEIVLFFSLKCGVLFDPHFLSTIVESFQYTEDYQMWVAYLEDDPDAIAYFEKRRRDMDEMEFRALIRNLKTCHKTKKDKRSEPNDKIIRVPEGHAAVELVEFCANDTTKACWDDYGMGPRRMGEVLFWWFIVPKMMEVGKIVGCEYAFLFAADETPDGELVRYYESAFHFRKMTTLGTIKPFYDMNCYFMGKRLRSLRFQYANFADLRDDDDLRGLDYYREFFFDNFNESEDADDNV